MVVYLKPICIRSRSWVRAQGDKRKKCH